MNNENEEIEEIEEYSKTHEKRKKSFSQISYKELIFFKEEIYKTIKEFEKKIKNETNISLNDFEKRIIEGEKTIEKFDNKFNIYAKKDELEEKKLELKTEINKKLQKQIDNITSSNIQISAIRNDLSNACFKYDKIFLDNLTIKGFIGDGCKYKNIKEYILQNKEELSKFDSINQKVLIDLKSFKSKTDSIIKEFGLQLETLRNSFGEYINMQIEKYDKKQQNIINELNDKINECYVKNSSFVEEIKNESLNLIKFVDEVKEIKDEINKMKNDIHDDLISNLEKTKKMDLTVLNEFNEIKKEFKNIKTNISSLSELLTENYDENINKKEIKNEIINNFNNTLINLMKDAKSEKMKIISKKSERKTSGTNLNEFKKGYSFAMKPGRRASQINMVYSMGNAQLINEEKNEDIIKHSLSIKKSLNSNINNSININNSNFNNNNNMNNRNSNNNNISNNNNTNVNNISINISSNNHNNILLNVNDNNQIENKSIVMDDVYKNRESIKNSFNNNSIKKITEKASKDKTNNKNESIKQTMSLSSLNSIDDDEIISNKKNKESEKMINTKISKNENFTQSKIELITQPSKTEINNIKKEDPNKNKNNFSIESRNLTFQSSEKLNNKNLCLTTNTSIEINENKKERKMTFRNKLKEQPLKLMNIEENNYNNKPINNLKLAHSNLLNYQNLNLNHKDKEHINSIYKTQRNLSSKIKKKFSSGFELIPDEDIIDMPLLKKENLEIDKNKNKLEKRIIELEFFTKKKFDELVKEIKNFIPIHFNSYVKNYIISETDYSKKFSHNMSIQTEKKNILYSAKSSNLSTDQNNRHYKTSANFHKKNNSML